MKNIGTIGMMVVVLGLVTSCSQPVEEAPKKPNILFIMTDDHAKNAMSIYNDKLIETPNLDRIADEGIVFNRSYVTNSICGPSRAVFMTGKYSHVNGFRHNYDEFDSANMTYPKILRQNGYNTAVVGKWHLKSVPAGFDYWNVLIDQGDYYNPTLVDMGDTIQHTGYATTVVTDLAIDWLDKRGEEDQPFCLLVQHKAPHRNWMPDTTHLKFGEQQYPLPANFYDSYENRQAAAEQDQSIDRMFMSMDMKLPVDKVVETGTGGGPEGFNAARNWKRTYNRMNEAQRAKWDEYYNPIADDFYAKELTGKELVEWKYQRYINDYLKCIMSVDDNVGRLLKYLEDKGELDNTLIVYTSDQGFYLGEHGWYDKRFMYEESFGMPLVMRYPKMITPGTVDNHLVANLDYAPTVMEFLGIETNEPWQGQSLVPLMKGEQVEEWRDGLYYHYYEYPFGWHKVKRHYGVRTDRYKLIHFYNDIDQWELYDMENDPEEMNNIYETADPELIVGLKKQLDQLQQQYGDEDIEVD
ncbi:MAG: sulfatase [Cyclobacteriaceae bacterium]